MAIRCLLTRNGLCSLLILSRHHLCSCQAALQLQQIMATRHQIMGGVLSSHNNVLGAYFSAV